MSGPEKPGLTTQTSPLSELAARVMHVVQVVLVYAGGAPAHAVMVLDRTPLLLGREATGPDAMAIPDAEVSRQHAQIEPDPSGDGWVVVDCGSRNGTLVNGLRQARAPLRHGTVIRVGRSLLVFVDVELSADARLVIETPALRGKSLQMQRVRGDIAIAAPSEVPVLVLGETGSGKECVAQELHRLSGRRGPFVAVNCAAIPQSLAESELFGHTAGAFTGAAGKRDGLFVAANGGTLFLDEVGELDASVQAKLLRALATGEVRPVGRSDAQRVETRVIAATLRDVAAQVEAEAFRADLFARLSGFTIQLPPLRARREDIFAIADTYLERTARGVTLSPTAAEAMLLHDWPYNVRELEQALTAAALRAGSGGVIRAEHLPPEVGQRVLVRADTTATAPPPPPLEVLVPRDVVPTAQQLSLVLERFGGNMALVAQFFGKDRKQVYRWAERLGVDVARFRVSDDKE